VLRAFDAGQRAEMVEPDGRIHVTCEYCSKAYSIAPETLSTTAA
jgi:molecular chaperone Hsp33